MNECGETTKPKMWVYIGKTSRCLYEWSKEHVCGVFQMEESNFIIKNWALEHEELNEPPAMKFSVIQNSYECPN